MPQVKTVEKKIQEVEGFKVHFLHGGKNVEVMQTYQHSILQRKWPRMHTLLVSIKQRYRSSMLVIILMFLWQVAERHLDRQNYQLYAIPI